jgi:plastocyanin
MGSSRTAHRAVLRTAAALVATAGLILSGAAAAGAMTHAASTPSTTIATTAAAKPAQVPIAKNMFTPAELTVSVGQAVVWTNEDAAPHTVTTTSAPVKFDSGAFGQGKSWSYTFTQTGVYKYYCAVHPDMVGTVTVVNAPATPAKPAKAKVHRAKVHKAAATPAAAGESMPGMGSGDNAAPTAANGNNAKTPHSDSSMPGMNMEHSPSARPAADDPISGAYNPFMQHLEYAHFNRGPGAQVQDISEFDQWLANHQKLFRMMLDPEVGPSSALGTAPVASTFMQHMDAAHWNRSPMGQANDISNFDSWNKAHLALFRMMLDQFVGKSSALGTSPGTSVFMQHMDAAHWNKSLNGQATDIVDNFPAWVASHQAMIQMMAASLSSGGSGH